MVSLLPLSNPETRFQLYDICLTPSDSTRSVATFQGDILVPVVQLITTLRLGP